MGQSMRTEEDQTQCEMVLEKVVVKDMRVQLTRTCVTPYKQDTIDEFIHF